MRGLRLQGKYTQRSITTFIQVYTDGRWVLIDPEALEEIPFNEVLLWPENTRSLLDVYGGKNSRIDFSVSSTQLSAARLAVQASQHSGSALVDFSIYSLPIREQNTFKLLLLIPLGALVVVILRNLVGIRTSGTFMPILIALTFMQTTLLLGLLTASLAYLVMINPYAEHLTFNFPELLLVLLAIIIMIGSYSGFRLVELGRFEPMTRV